jgi:hypothetical protein
MLNNTPPITPSFLRPTGTKWLTNHVALHATGTPLALIGTTFLETVQLHIPEVLERFGINRA